MSRIKDCVPRDWWKTQFDETYLLTDGDVLSNEAATLIDAEWIKEHTRPGGKILDVGCGPGRLALPLVKAGFDYTGLDSSEAMIKVAVEQHRDVAGAWWICDDFRVSLRALNYYDALLMFGSFGFYDDPRDDFRVLHRAHALLADGGKLFMDIPNGDLDDEETIPTRSWEERDGMYILRRREFRDQAVNGAAEVYTQEIVLNPTQGAWADNYYRIRLYSPGQIRVMLADAGFKLADDAIEYAATGGDDPGVMARRLRIVACK